MKRKKVFLQEQGDLSTQSESFEHLNQNNQKSKQSTDRRDESIDKRQIRDVHLFDYYPFQDYYTKSYMHRDICTHLLISPVNDFLITASVDGHVKFWKILDYERTCSGELEFVKDFRAHLCAINCIELNKDYKLLASTGKDDQSLKIFHVLTFDMICMVQLDYVPSSLAFTATEFLVTCDSKSNCLYVYETNSFRLLYMNKEVHRNPIRLMTGHNRAGLLTLDSSGFLELSDVRYDAIYPMGLPQVAFVSKLDTDLYVFLDQKRAEEIKGCPTAMRFSHDGRFFAISLSSGMVVVFESKWCRLVSIIRPNQLINGNADCSNDVSDECDIDKSRRNIVEEDFLRQSGVFSVDFDSFNSNNLFIPTSKGIAIVKIVNASNCDGAGTLSETNELLGWIGSHESLRFNHIVLWTEKPTLTNDPGRRLDRRLYTLAWKKNRVFAFTNSPSSTIDYEHRDVCNEAALIGSVEHHREQISSTSVTTGANNDPIISTTRNDECSTQSAHLRSKGIIHTSLGDVHFILFPKECPKTVENFCKLADIGYYNGNIFHRVIRQFMIQTGDPEGTGAGGSSIWGEDFEDEIVDSLKHDKPYTLSMANAGPNTNGSQFFITVMSAPWLDGKHTIFGRVVMGMDVVHKINNLKTDKHDKPLDEARILSITLKQTREPSNSASGSDASS